MRKIFKLWGVFVVLFLSFWAIASFFNDGFFPMHDDTQVVRVSQMTQALADGHFPVRWVKDLGYGYGYPLFNFYAPLPYYFGGILGLWGVDLLVATKIMMVVGILLSGVFMYLLAQEFWGKAGGVVSGLFYMYAPYHAVDIYVRGAVAEFWAYAFIPLLFYGLWKIYQQQKWRWIIVGAIGLAGVILSHNLTALMLLPLFTIAALFYCCIAIKKRKIFIIYHLSFIILLGLGISAFYWLPALWEMNYTNVASQVGGGANFRDHFVCWQQLWDSPWGFGGSIPGCLDGLSFKIGKLHIVSILITVVLTTIISLKNRFPHYNDTYHYSDKVLAVFIFLSGFVFSSLLTLELSRSLWELVSPISFIQYPWRFLIFASFFSSFLAGAVVWFLRHSNTRLYYIRLRIQNTSSLMLVHYSGVGFLLFFLLFFNVKLFEPQTILSRTVNDYVNENNIKWTTSKISDEYMPKNFAKPKTEEEVSQKRVSAGEVVLDKTQKLVFVTNFEKEKTALVNIAPFPAWKASLDGNLTPYVSKSNGMEIWLPSGKHEVEFSFSSTPVENAGNIITVISIAVLIGGILVLKAGLLTRFTL